MQEVRNYVRKAVEAFSKKDSDAVCSLIMLEEGDPNLQQLQNALYNVSWHDFMIYLERRVRTRLEIERKAIC